jgi:deazaflavin-dependent oxidoreductase (nitroreductase family)
MNLSKIESRIESIPAVQALGTRLLKVHQLIYLSSGGRIGHRLGGTRALLLRTVGAKTGEPRTNALTYVRDGKDYVVVASLGGAPRSPGWYHNLRANPEVEIQVGTKRIPVRARAVLAGDADRERLWTLADTNNNGRYSEYQKATSRTIPVVVLTPR